MKLLWRERQFTPEDLARNTAKVLGPDISVEPITLKAGDCYFDIRFDPKTEKKCGARVNRVPDSKEIKAFRFVRGREPIGYPVLFTPLTSNSKRR